MVVFFGNSDREVWLSEFDKDFSAVMQELEARLPGFISPDGLAGAQPFQKATRVLWERNDQRGQ